MDEPARLACLPIQACPKQPEASPVDVLDAVIVAGAFAPVAPPLAVDALGWGERGPLTAEVTVIQQADVMAISEEAYARLVGGP